MQERTKTILVVISLLIVCGFALWLSFEDVQDQVDQCNSILGNESIVCKTALNTYWEQHNQCVAECARINKETGWRCVC